MCGSSHAERGTRRSAVVVRAVDRLTRLRTATTGPGIGSRRLVSPRRNTQGRSSGVRFVRSAGGLPPVSAHSDGPRLMPRPSRARLITGIVQRQPGRAPDPGSAGRGASASAGGCARRSPASPGSPSCVGGLIAHHVADGLRLAAVQRGPRGVDAAERGQQAGRGGRAEPAYAVQVVGRVAAQRGVVPVLPGLRRRTARAAPAASTRTASSKPPLRTRSTDVVSSISANASRSLVISTDRQPLRRACAAELASTSSASYAGGTTVHIPAARSSSGAPAICSARSAGLSGRCALYPG